MAAAFGRRNRERGVPRRYPSQPRENNTSIDGKVSWSSWNVWNGANARGASGGAPFRVQGRAWNGLLPEIFQTERSSSVTTP